MSTIVTRNGKGSALTWTEMDDNFTNLNTDKIESGDNVTLGNVTVTSINASTYVGLPATAVAWGGITGTLSNQTDLQTALNAKAALAGATFTGEVVTVASGTGSAGLNLPHGAAPSSPTNGDFWTTTAGAYVRINGSTVGPLAASGGSPAWGSITGTLSAQTDLDTALSGKQPLDSDLTTIAGLTATTDNFLQAKSSAWASRTVAQVSTDLQSTGLVADSVGFRQVPQNLQATNYTIVAADSGKHLYHLTGGTTSTFTIPANGSVAFPVGTAITFVNDGASGNLTIAITTDVLRLAGAGTTGSRTLAPYGVATALKIASVVWIISGTGLT